MNDRNQFIAQMCHIEAAAPGGPRFNPAQSDADRGSADNLMVLCYRHHVETDDVVRFSTTALQEMKRTHEHRFANQPSAIDSAVVERIALEVSDYWARVDVANSQEHIVPDLRIKIDASATASQLVQSLLESLDSLDLLHIELTESAESLPEDIRAALTKAGYNLSAWDSLVGRDNPVILRDWDWINLGLPNHMGRLRVLAEQLEIRVLEYDVAADPTNLRLREMLTERRAQFLDGARMWGLVD